MATEQPVVLEGVPIMFRNFSGKPDKFNPQGGRRRFVIGLDPGVAEALAADGWPVKILPPRSEEEGDTPTPIMEVKINFEGFKPPKIVLVTTRGRTHLDETDVGQLDYADIVNADIILNPYNWENSRGKGVSAYLASLFVTIEEDPLEIKYSEMDKQGA